MTRKSTVLLIVLTIIVAVAIFIPIGIAPNNVGVNYKNVSVITHANITNSRPEVLTVRISELVNLSARNITVAAGSFKEVLCNASLRDWNGFADIAYVNATLYYVPTSGHNFSDDNNTHYTNPNCTTEGNGNGYLVNYQCNFSVIYYANNGTWACNVTVMDNHSSTGYGMNTTTFNPVYALNVTDGMDFGNLAVDAYSINTTANVSNIGNMAINVTIDGYGIRRGDGLAMNCSLGGNITVDNQRFATSDVDWVSMTALTSNPQMIPGITIMKQNSSTVNSNTTYWQLFSSSANNPGGNCTGYIVFTAVAP